MKLIAKKTFGINGIIYEKGDEVTNVPSKGTIIKLNEKGFIEPLTAKQIQEIGKQPKKINPNERGEKDESSL